MYWHIIFKNVFKAVFTWFYKKKCTFCFIKIIAKKLQEINMNSFLDTGWLGITTKLPPWPGIHGRITRDTNYHWSQWWFFPSMDNYGASWSISNYIASGLLLNVFSLRVREVKMASLTLLKDENTTGLFGPVESGLQNLIL